MLLRGGRIAVDLEGGVVHQDGAVLIEDGRVTALGPSAGVQAPAGFTTWRSGLRMRTTMRGRID